MKSRYLIIPFTILGDIGVLLLALLVSLSVRYSTLPEVEFLALHAEPFILVLVSSLCVFFVSGLYDIFGITHVRSVLRKIASAQLANIFFAVLFFYLITVWGITPKTTLALYVFFSTLFLFVWRGLLLPRVITRAARIDTILVAEKKEGVELYNALGIETPYPLHISNKFFVDTDTTSTDVKVYLKSLNIKPDQTIVVDMRSRALFDVAADVYEHAGRGGDVRDFVEVYEEVFGKIPESSLSAENIVRYVYTKNKGYDVLKRMMDIAIALPLFVLSLAAYPFVYIGIKIQDGGEIFFVHDRMGRGGKRIKLYKFRSMTFSDTSAVWVKTEGNKNHVTPFGYFIRKTRVDELPQLWNVLRGDMSLIGPRPDIWSLGVKCGEEIPFFKARLVATPGLSGWAQTHMTKPPQNIEETKEKLLYDLYYIKNRSLTLDLLIALKTIKTLLSREGM